MFAPRSQTMYFLLYFTLLFFSFLFQRSHSSLIYFYRAFIKKIFLSIKILMQFILYYFLLAVYLKYIYIYIYIYLILMFHAYSHVKCDYFINKNNYSICFWIVKNEWKLRFKSAVDWQGHLNIIYFNLLFYGKHLILIVLGMQTMHTCNNSNSKACLVWSLQMNITIIFFPPLNKHNLLKDSH
jgi:hypothetical protein